jgi:amino acid transporter
MAHRVDVPGGVSGPVAEPAAAERPHQFGLPAAMALIVGSIIGVGIFNLPTSLASYGPITLVSMALTTVGVLAAKVRDPDRNVPRATVLGTIAVVFSILFIVYSRNTGHSFWVYWAPYFLAAGALLLGIPVYLAQRGHMTNPAPVPPYRPPATSGKHS